MYYSIKEIASLFNSNRISKFDAIAGATALDDNGTKKLEAALNAMGSKKSIFRNRCMKGLASHAPRK
jgi:hypothetical protein